MKSFCFLVLVVFLVYSCKSKEDSPSHIPVVQKELQKSLSDDSLRIILEKVKKFSEKYTPAIVGSVALPSDIPDSIAHFFKVLRINGNEDYDRYISLLFLKIYRSHLECCHQGYDLRGCCGGQIDEQSNPLIYEYNQLTKALDTLGHIEFLNSAFMPMGWIEKNPSLLNYQYLKIENDRIEQIKDSIRKDLYWFL